MPTGAPSKTASSSAWAAWASSSARRSAEVSTTTAPTPRTRPSASATGYRFSRKQRRSPGAAAVSPSMSIAPDGARVSSTCRIAASTSAPVSPSIWPTVRPMWSCTGWPLMAASAGLMRWKRRSSSTKARPTGACS